MSPSEDIANEDLVAQALDNLVNQFASPMDFLRELVQNSIDAGTPRIEVEVSFEPQSEHRGVVEILVQDFGQGMDEDVIDSQLTRLFSSAKEGDRTAIGKFGIGFTSVFALRPDAVRVLTAKHGENWEVVFHGDRSFEKRRYDEPVQGTGIRIYKRVRNSKVAELVCDARDSLVRWCEHAETPIQFFDRTSAAPVATVDEEDVFGAFGEEVDEGERINGAFELGDCDHQTHHTEGGVSVVVGYASDAQSWSFFSGGLTLLRSHDASHLGRYRSDFEGMSFKIRSDTIGHTLTRDNVIQDEAWMQGMEVAKRAAILHRASMLKACEEAVGRGDHASLSKWHGQIAADLAREPLDLKAQILDDGRGVAVSVQDLVDAAWHQGLAAIYEIHPGDRDVADRLAERRHPIVRCDDGTRDLVAGSAVWPMFGMKVINKLINPTPFSILTANQEFALCQTLAFDTLEEPHQRLLEAASRCLEAISQGSVTLGACHLSESSPVLSVRQAADGLVRKGRVEEKRADKASFLGVTLNLLYEKHLVNLRHPHVAALLRLNDVEMAGLALAQAVVFTEDRFTLSHAIALRSHATRQWVTHGS